ncbi:MAG: NuoI/complex I 23 kDa subunit family protein [Dissulfurispiraceae bacterium]
MIKYRERVRSIFFLDILKGMLLTLKSLFSRPVTRQYPETKRSVQSGYRGLHALTKHPSTAEARCVGCGLCAAVCPSQCIHIHTTEGPGNSKIVERYDIEILRCVYCGLCVEACPYAAIALTEHYEYSEFSREALFMTRERLLDNYDAYMGREKDEQYFLSYWHPRRSDFGMPEDQPKFRKRS